jgi:hypothetical protein
VPCTKILSSPVVLPSELDNTHLVTWLFLVLVVVLNICFENVDRKATISIT